MKTQTPPLPWPKRQNGYLEKVFDLYQDEVAANNDEEVGNPYSICTNSCIWLQENYFQEAIMYGYWAEDNPVAQVGNAEGGHNFLLIEDRYIIDFWYKDIYAPDAPLFLDIVEDRNLAVVMYGPREKWSKPPSI